ncbi:4-hydroxy-3-methylbut-2-enyl diphosphate reductase [Aquisalimonas lutea]|uniref:4-hydroxy-3-methylbut-2-enyl diphosphate reductase n=1 Tax=Aquisalimonas lutea TaxID=1327750 RepID=UPI0025B55A75|nr:4-hydroxy-3-methylbut-2-enyl diphosphate reductase [Aquisalimonas lutea]MDN3517453.1 4-hydroxy-3-methylbut-2-enyl diphosphate reductase [Aquisalimonas lutea]
MPRILLANPRGFCAGVDRAIIIVERALENFGAPIYVRHEVVHNKRVVDGLRDKGAVFVEQLHEVPDGATVIFSAHGVPQSVRDEAAERGLRVFDATCPLVTKVHLEVEKHARAGREVVLIGHDGHPEVEGTMGQYIGEGAEQGGIYLVETVADVARLQVKNPDDLAFVSQTTLSTDDTAAIIEALQARFPAVQGPRKDDICYATQNRQDAVKEMAAEADMLIVVGARNSSNSTRLRELGERMGIPAYQIDSAEDLREEWIRGHELIGLTAGASAPEELVHEVIQRLKGWGVDDPRELKGQAENVVFSLPRDLVRAGKASAAQG